MLVSPLRYPGGKSKLYGLFSNILQHNNLKNARYCEPYAGGAGLALRLLSTGLIEHASINDADEAIWAFWFSVLFSNREMCRLIETATLNIDEWYAQREVWRRKDISDPLALGFATFYLNRTNRSGIIEGAGPVGGYAQAGVWRLDARFDRSKQAEAIRALLPFQSRIDISKLDALDFMEETLADESALTYLDPPYYVKGSKLYRNFYVHSDHVAVRDAVVRHRDRRWIVSYDAAEAILALYSNFEPVRYVLHYSAGAVGSGQEVIYLSDALSMPAMDGFINRRVLAVA